MNSYLYILFLKKMTRLKFHVSNMHLKSVSNPFNAVILEFSSLMFPELGDLHVHVHFLIFDYRAGDQFVFALFIARLFKLVVEMKL